jgi:hypothetical protein
MKVDKTFVEKNRNTIDDEYVNGIKESGMDFSIFLAHSKKDTSEIVCLKFKKKYGMDYSSLVKSVLDKKKRGSFDMFFFEMTDDLMEWEFAEAARHWWSGKIKKMTMGSC